MESTQISAHPSRTDAAMLAFSERFQAEQFLNHGSEIPHIGKVELSWMPNPVTSPFSAAATDTSKDTNMDESMDVGGGASAAAAARPAATAEMDYDVADDDDNWLVD
jgi:hypothetical protein